MSAGFFPGPWRSEGASVKAITHGREFTIARANTQKFTPESAAEHARLFAASQDMLRALQELRKQLREHVKMDVKTHYSLMVADAAAGSAIAKAVQS